MYRNVPDGGAALPLDQETTISVTSTCRMARHVLLGGSSYIGAVPSRRRSALIGMALEAYLEDAGYEVAGPFATCAAALVSLDTQTPQVAVIDYRLQDGCCLKRVLRARGIPFLVYSGLPRLPDLSPEFEGAVWLEKPTDRPELLKAVAKLVNGRPGASLGRLTDQVPDKTADHSGLDQRVGLGP
jgi:DNA-binding response OmpR family regulator